MLHNIDICVYSHTDFLDILQIQTDYIKDLPNNSTLFLNRNTYDLHSLYSNYNNVILYDDSKSYASRLLECINQINKEYFLFIHDNDIMLNIDNIILSKLYNLMLEKSIDRIDLKQAPHKLIKTNISFKLDDTENDIKLIHNTNPTDYIYNVNPSIWKRESFLDILNQFPYKTYRNIEGSDVQIYCTKFKIFSTYSPQFLNCGYFMCIKFFIFLHITHGGKLLKLNNNYINSQGQSYIDIGKEYEKIVEKYSLKLSKRWT